MGLLWELRVQGEMLADRYSLIEPLGSGGMGQVWRAWDSALGRDVAVKLLAAPPGDAAADQRFMEEAHAAARLTDAGIATVYDFGQAADGRLFLVMELVTGRSLTEMLAAQGQLSWERVADLGAQAARALAVAHAAGVVHRDVKPANLLVRDDGVLKVVDFGIAQLVVHATTAAGGPVLGTAAYTAPEQALRHPVGPAADLYALGCVLYELLAGTPPFVGEDAAQVLYRHVHEHPARLGDIRPDAPPQLLRIVDSLLAKNPDDRPRGAAEAARQLTAVMTEAAAAQATSLLPAIGDATAPLPRIVGGPGPGEPRTSRRRPRRGARPPLPLAVGGLVAAGAGLLALLFFLVGGDSDEASTASSPDSSAASASANAESGDDSSSASPTPPSATPTRTASKRPTATPGATTALAAAQDPAELGGRLVSALAAESSAMEPDLYRDAQKEAAEINQKLQQGQTSKAAEKARDLSQRLGDAQQKGKWSGDAQVMQLLDQLAAG